MSVPDAFHAPEAPPVPRAGGVYTVMQIGVATFLGSPIAGGVLLALNARRLGVPAGRALGMVALVLVGIFVAALVLPEGVPGFAFGLAGFLATRAIAEVEQGRAIARHLDQGGRQASWLVAIGIALVPMVLFVGLFVLLLMAEAGAL